MQTKTINLYSFNELSKEAQEKAHNYYLNNNSTYPYLTELLTDNLHEYCKDKNIDIDSLEHVFYSLSNSQGDGVVFTGSFTYKNHAIEVTHKDRYYHAYSVDMEDLTQTPEDIENGLYDDTIEKDFQIVYVDICKQLEKDGYAEIEHNDSLQYFSDLAEANDYMFYNDGTLYTNTNN